MRFILINKTQTPGRVILDVSGVTSRVGKLYSLTAPIVTATTGVTFGGFAAEGATPKTALRSTVVDATSAHVTPPLTQFSLLVPSATAVLFVVS